MLQNLSNWAYGSRMLWDSPMETIVEKFLLPEWCHSKGNHLLLWDLSFHCWQLASSRRRSCRGLEYQETHNLHPSSPLPDWKTDNASPLSLSSVGVRTSQGSDCIWMGRCSGAQKGTILNILILMSWQQVLFCPSPAKDMLLVPFLEWIIQQWHH